MHVNDLVKRVGLPLGVAVVVSSCGGSTESKTATDLCDAISLPGATFVSYKQKLNDSNHYAHEWAEFNSQARFFFDDSEDAGTYECLNQQTVQFTHAETNAQETLTFSESFDSFIVVREGEADPTTFIRALPEAEVDLCAMVKNRYYVEDDATDLATDDFIFLNFGDDEAVEYRLYGTSTKDGTFDCSGNDLHIHNAPGGSLRVGAIYLREQGSGLYLLTDNQTRINLTETDPEALTPVCEAIVGTTFYSQNLLGTGVTARHLPVIFEDERITFTEGDAVFESAYACENNVVTVTRGPSGTPATLEFEEDISQFIERDAFGQEVSVYIKAPFKPNADCDSVVGAAYSEVMPISEIVAESEVSDPLVEAAPMRFAFASGNSVEFGLGDDILYRGTYDCALETLHVHHEFTGDLAAEIQLRSDKTSAEVTVTGSDAVTTLRKEDPDTCYQYDGLTYKAPELTDNFGWYRHPWVDFYDGMVEFVQQGAVLPEPYTCNANNPLEITFGQNGGYATFSADLNQMEVIRFPSNPVTEIYYRASDEFKAACELVHGKYYSAISVTQEQGESDTESQDNLVTDPVPAPYIQFTMSDTGKTAEYFLGDINGSGHYDCELGKLHIHTNGQGAEVMAVEVSEDGSIIEVSTDSDTLSLYSLSI